MPTCKIDEPEAPFCRDAEHDPPPMQVFEPGLYEHECPKCHKKQFFRISSFSAEVEDAIQQAAFLRRGDE